MTENAKNLLALDSSVRYVAINQRGAIAEMMQSERHASFNPPETDRMEELVVNPVALELFARSAATSTSGACGFSSCATGCSSR